MIWMRPTQLDQPMAGALFLLGEITKVGKTESMAAMPGKFWSSYSLKLFGLIHKWPSHDPFSPADESVFMGLVVRSCHFDVTACAEARRLDKT